MISMSNVTSETFGSTSAAPGSGIGSGTTSLGSSIIAGILILNSTVNASSWTPDSGGGSGSGIGTGSVTSGISKIGDIMVWNSNVTASSLSSHLNGGSGIGTGSFASGVSMIGIIRIFHSQVDAKNKSTRLYLTNAPVVTGSGIGGGSYQNGNSTIDGIEIFHSQVVGNSSTQGNGGSGIGSGSGLRGTGGIATNSTIGYILIVNSTVEAIASSTEYSGGSGIGGGYLDSGSSIIDDFTIMDSIISAQGSQKCPSIGNDLVRGQLKTLRFIGRNFVNSTSSLTASQINASLILFSNTSVVCVTKTMPLFSTSPESSGWFDLVVFYRTAATSSTERLSSLSGPFLHIGQLNIQNYKSGTLCISKSDYERCFDGYTVGDRKSVV
jgi:hypothetical protein